MTEACLNLKTHQKYNSSREKEPVEHMAKCNKTKLIRSPFQWKRFGWLSCFHTFSLLLLLGFFRKMMVCARLNMSLPIYLSLFRFPRPHVFGSGIQVKIPVECTFCHVYVGACYINNASCVRPQRSASNWHCQFSVIYTMQRYVRRSAFCVLSAILTVFVRAYYVPMVCAAKRICAAGPNGIRVR